MFTHISAHYVLNDAFPNDIDIILSKVGHDVAFMLDIL